MNKYRYLEFGLAILPGQQSFTLIDRPQSQNTATPLSLNLHPAIPE
jgi:hypothetical protein